MQENMRAAMSKKGFSVVEVFSPCPTHYGKHNDLKAAASALKWLKEKALPFAAWQGLPAEKRKDRFPIGVIREDNAPDFSSCYEQMRSRSQKGRPD
jgi:2-oxoglutarate ferredoxin oxidoreductase subunit beta